jgi:Dyp-type peroxidase family
MPAAQFLTQFPVNPTDPILDDLQGNILKGHGRQFTFNLFLSFKPGQQASVRTWIANFSNVFVTSARKQLDETALFHSQHIPGGIFTSFYLSAAGYAYLGVPAAKMPTDSQFAHGMQASGAALHDPAPATWSPGLNGASGAIHAMVLIADADVHLARGLARAVRLSLVDKGVVVATERGVVLRNAKGDGIEHNNYVDGISQPVFFADEMPAHHDQWNPSATPSLMLVADPGGKDGNSLGSYFVFRKLEQNVRGFKANEKAMAAAVLAPGADPELAGAMLVGRFEGGTPVLLSSTDTNPGPANQENNFNFAAMGSESKCPFQAHIRKSAPRTDVGGPVFNKTKRLVRRGIPFEDKPRVRNAEGNLSDNPADQPTGGVGLLFMCYVANIQGQFEFVQKSWLNEPSFSQPSTGKDPIVGEPHAGPSGTMYQWPTNWGSSTKKPAAFGDFVTMRGGEYFFAPSLSMLKSLRPSAPIVVKHPNILDDLRLSLGPLFPHLQVLDPVLQLFVPDPVDTGAGVGPTSLAPA